MNPWSKSASDCASSEPATGMSIREKPTRIQIGQEVNGVRFMDITPFSLWQFVFLSSAVVIPKRLLQLRTSDPGYVSIHCRNVAIPAQPRGCPDKLATM